jgi:hypothetical protein
MNAGNYAIAAVVATAKGATKQTAVPLQIPFFRTSPPNFSINLLINPST